MRAEVRIVQDQQETVNSVEVSNYEKEMLLAKYGYTNPQPSSFTSDQPKNELSFEDRVKQLEEGERIRNHQKMMRERGPKPMSFDGEYQNQVKYGSDSDLGLTFKIEITSNMDLPKD